MNVQSIVILLIIIVACAIVVYLMIRQHKSGNPCAGCSCAGTCSGSCESVKKEK